MAEKDVVITYETLFELLRIEKGREELQKLDETFMQDVATYLEQKKSTFKPKPADNVFFSLDSNKAIVELENIKKILIYSKSTVHL